MPKWPKCEWCGTLDGVFRCPMCHEFTCAECVTYVNMYPDSDEGRCEHEKFVPIEADNWNVKDADDINLTAKTKTATSWNPWVELAKDVD